MREIRLETRRPDAEVAALEGSFYSERDLVLVVGPEDGPTRIFKPDGSVLLVWVPAALTPSVCATAYSHLRHVDGSAHNRGTASGYKAVRPLRQDGTRSNTTRVPQEVLSNELRGVRSAVAGAMERGSHRYPACRLTAFNLNHPQRFAASLPFFREVDGIFAQYLPERHAAQMEMVRRTHPAWIVSGTAFSTVTVNRDFRTAIHKDRGDYQDGFGVMTCFRAGTFEGCFTAFPAFGVGVDMRTGGVLLADVHEWHGNTELRGTPGLFERLSVVLYYRALMHRCLSPEGELERVRLRKPGDPIWPEIEPARRKRRRDRRKPG